MEQITIYFVTNIGKAFGGAKRIPKGTTVQELLDIEMPGQPHGNYRVSVNSQEVSRSQELKEGDRLTVSPTKMAAGLES